MKAYFSSKTTRALLILSLLCMAIAMTPAFAQWDKTNWGLVTSSVYGTSETGTYAGAELFAGPNKLFNQYFAGVVPNGARVTPAGISAQIGMNPWERC